MKNKFNETPSGCLEWTGKLGRTGYGQCKVGRKYWMVHRLAWAERNGPIPDGLFVLHRCDNRRCARIEHLFLGTKADNARDRDAKGRGGCGRHESHGMASKMNWDRVKQLRELAASGLSHAELARRFGISPAHATRIARGDRWSESIGRRH